MDLTNDLKDLLDARQRGEAARTHFWTADKRSTIVKYLRQGADGVTTNKVANAIESVKSLSNFRRLATIYDDPFKLYFPL